MRELARIAVRSGIVSPDMTAEFRKWGYFLDSPGGANPPPATKEEFVQQVEEALESEDLVMVRETDLAALEQYLTTQKLGKIVVIENGEAVKFDITYGRTTTGEYIIAWRGEAISELITNGYTYLLESDDTQIFFTKVRDLFFGDTKSFIVCTPSAKQYPDKVLP
jgi:hypothetical protein